MQSIRRRKRIDPRRIVVILALFHSFNAKGAEFIDMGQYPGSVFTSALPVNFGGDTISADGQSVLGRACINCRLGGYSQHVLWNANSGWEVVGADARSGNFIGTGLSGDGHVVVGTTVENSNGVLEEAARWTESSGTVELGLPFHAIADTTNYDGSIIAGQLRDNSGDIFRWSADGKFERFHVTERDDSSRFVTGISDDGTVIAGHDGTITTGLEIGARSAWRWTEDTGRVDLGALNNGNYTYSVDMTRDGSTIVGYSGVPEGNYFWEVKPFRWTVDSGIETLPGWNDNMWGEARAVSDDGRIIVGRYNEGLERDDYRGGFIWQAGIGVRDLRAFLAEDVGLAEELEGWSEITPSLLSGDGRRIVGTGTYEQEQEESSWMVILDALPLAGDFNENGTLDSADIDALTLAIRQGTLDPSFDLTLDGTIDGHDHFAWVHDFANTYFGDSNLDGRFNSADLVAVFQFGEYEDSVAGNSTWTTGDWNGDGEFTSADFVIAFVDGGYEGDLRSISHAVPEPTSQIQLTFVIAIALTSYEKCRRHL